jgi:multidrug efflux pump
VILSDAAIRNRTTVGVLTFLILVYGIYSYLSLPREAAPDVPVPIILVTTSYEGVAPADVESSITIKIERELAGLKGLKEIRSASAEGMSIIIVEFMPDVKIDDAMQYVRDKVELARKDLPDEAEEPVLTEINIAEFPIMMVNISGEVSPVILKEIADRMEDVIEGIPGVLNCEVLGALEREIRIEIDQDKVAAYSLTIPEILTLIPSENVNISAGGLESPGTKFNVRVPAEFVEPEEVDALVIAHRNGRPIYLTDVATVRDTFKDRTSFSRLDGKDTVTLAVQKRVGESILPIAEAVRRVVAEFSRRAPAGVRFDITLDQSRDIRMMIADLENNLLSGMILVVVVIVAFLGWRPALIVALEIPLSMLLACIGLQLLGCTLNMVVLFSLIMAVGMVVDNAIVIVENIFRHYQLGGSRLEAAMRGAAEVAWPVITSTATTVAAFLPLIFWPGIMGSFMKYLPITLCLTLVSSLFVALVINTSMSSALIARRAAAAGPGRFLRGYRQLLHLALEHRFTTVSLSALLLVGLAIAYGRFGHGVELFPEFDPRRGIISIRCPQGTNIRQTDALARVIEERIKPFADDLEHVITNVGNVGGGRPGESGGDHQATITLLFHDYEQRRRPSAAVLAEIRNLLADLAGAEIKVEKQKEGPPVGDAVTVRIIGEDFKLLQTISEQARQKIASVPGLVNLRSDHEASRPELAFRVDRQRAMLHGVNTATVGNFLKTAVFGTEVSKYRQFNEEYDITVRLPPLQRQTIDDLLRLRVPNIRGEPIPLSSLGQFEYTGGYGTIRRINQKRVITLTAGAEGRLATEVLRDVQQRLAELPLPLGYEIRYAGQNEEQEKAQSFLFRAFWIALLLIMLILVAQFNSLAVPLIIMTTLVLSLIGVLAGLLICRMPFGIIMTGIGVISLAGVVVNNAIVLLDYTRQLQRRGLSLLEAAVEAGATRLRPVLLTAGTTVLGLIPMATGVSYDFHKMAWALKSESSQWWASMAVAIIFGLSFATILTLVVVPTLYVSLMRLAQRIGLSIDGRRTESGPGNLPAPELPQIT